MSTVSTIQHLTIGAQIPQEALPGSCASSAQVSANTRRVVDISTLVDRAMREEVDINGLRYLAFDELPGVRENAPFRFCARQLVARYVELLVLQDELRREWCRHGVNDIGITQKKSSGPNVDSFNMVNQAAFWREFIILSAVAANIVQHFSGVTKAYGGTPKPPGCWREGLEGAFVALALRLKWQVTGVAKIAKESIPFLGNDVPSSRTVDGAVLYTLKCVNRLQSSRTEAILESENQVKIAQALATETIEAFTARLLKQAAMSENVL
jgi:hypothetical protein